DIGAYPGADSHKKPLPVDVGINRIEWDLKLEGAKKIAGAVVDAGDAEDGPIALPGDYSVKLTVDGSTITQPLKLNPDPRLSAPVPYSGAKFSLVADPKEAEELKKLLAKVPSLAFRIETESFPFAGGLEEQHKFALALRDDINSLTTTVT